MDLGLAGKVAMVGGGSRGLGYAVARLLLREGARVSIASSRTDAITAAASRLTGETSSADVLASTADLKSADAITAWFDATNALVEILERAGLRGAELARAYLWVAEVTMGCVVNEASIPYTEQIAGARNALPEMSEDARKRHALLLSHLAAMDGDAFFALVAERTVAALNGRP